MIDSLTDVISNEAKKLLQASQKDVPLSEAEYDALEALCRCAKALKTGEKEDPPDDLEEESDEELLGKVGPGASESGPIRQGLPTGGSPGCAGGVKYGDQVTCRSSDAPHNYSPERCDSPIPVKP